MTSAIKAILFTSLGLFTALGGGAFAIYGTLSPCEALRRDILRQVKKTMEADREIEVLTPNECLQKLILN